MKGLVPVAPGQRIGAAGAARHAGSLNSENMAILFQADMNLRVFFASLLLPCLLLAAAGSVIRDFNLTPDERFSKQRGYFYYYNWSNFKPEVARQQLSDVVINYGPLFDVVIAASAAWLEESGLVTDAVVAHHIPVLISAAIALWATFMLAYLLFGSVTAALLAGLNLLLLPRFFGASTNNLKDIPFCAFFILTLLLLVYAERRRSLFWAACAGSMIGASYAVRISAIFILPVFLPWLLWTVRASKDWLGAGVRLLVSASLALLTIPVAWPYYRFDYFERIKETVGLFARHPWVGETLYLGHMYPGREVPWHYPFLFFGITTPLYILLFAVSGMVMSLAARQSPPFSRIKGAGLLLCVWFCAPLLAHGLSGSPKYDTIRHYVFVFPALAILSAGAIYRFGLQLKAFFPRHAFELYAGMIAALILFQVTALIRLHPYQYIYYNELVGGLRGAEGRFPLDYWGQSLKEAGRWIAAQAPAGSRVMVEPSWARLLGLDLDYFGIVWMPSQYPDYLVQTRIAASFPPPALPGATSPKPKLVYSAGIAGVKLVRIFAYPENTLFPRKGLLPAAEQNLRNAAPGLQISTFNNQFFSGKTLRGLAAEPRVAYAHEPRNSRRFSGFLLSAERQTRCFKLTSDDSSALLLNGRVIALANSSRPSHNVVTLDRGFHQMTLEHNNTGGFSFLKLLWSPYNAETESCGSFQAVPAELFFHETETGKEP